MNCEFKYCIYNKNSKCEFEKVAINALGMCDDCIIVTLTTDLLEATKKQHLQKLHTIYFDENGWD